MRFEERELKPYAEPVSATELQEGSVYFLVIYTPGDIPIMETWVFIGRDLEPDDQSILYFQNVISYRNGIRYHVSDGDAAASNDDFVVYAENEINHIFEYERALDGLIKCSLRRKKLDLMERIHFDGREFQPYPEPVTAAELKEGSVYFALNYVDDDMLVPVMDTRVFVGRNLEPHERGKVYFEDEGSYRNGVCYGAIEKDKRTPFYIESENALDHVFDFEHALDELMRCSLRRRRA